MHSGRPLDPSSASGSDPGPGSCASLGHSEAPTLPPTTDGGGAATAASESFLKPANDEMSYRHLVLPNGVHVMLVSDPTADKAGAAMDVCVGSMADPNELPGLAHFTEHMLFYSSEKYPIEDEYNKFITDHGGITNAYTSSEHTNYHFDINWESLEPALDRFAQFFIAPTISADGIEREVRAVDSEHGKNLSQDAWRKAQVSKATANISHPWARFSTGNRDTLYVNPLAVGTDPRGAVIEFYNRHYSANRCALAVLGRQPLDELEAMVRSKFCDIPDKQLPRAVYPEDVFLPEQMGVLLRIVPVREGQSLELVWQVPSSERLYREQPLGYLSHLLGHEGEGSVFAALKAAGWASALVAGESSGGLSFVSFFMVHVELTEVGQRNIRDVATTIFRYLALLRRPGGICDRIWEEVRGLAQLQFDTKDKSKPMTYCTNLAGGLQAYPPMEMLPAMYSIPRVFSPEAIREALDLLTPQRVRAFWISKNHLTNGQSPTAAAAGPDASAAAAVDVGGSPSAAAAAAIDGAAATVGAVKEGGGDANGTALRTEPVYGTRYDIGPLPADWLEAWVSAQPEGEPRLHLPTPNRFIPTDLSLATEEASACGPEPQPHVAVAVPGRLRLWHCADVRFGQPKAVLYLDVQSPEAYSSPRAAVMTRLFVKLMLDYLNEVAYPAQQAGLDYNLLNTQSGWQLLISGYNHKMHELLGEVLARLAGFKVLPGRFEFVREGIVREYANQLHNQPYSWAMYRAEMLTTARRWPIEVYGSSAASVTADELQDFVRRLTSRCFVEGLAAGNLRRREVLRCGAMLLSCLRDRCGTAALHPCEAAELRVLRVPPPPPSAAAAAAAAAAGGEEVRDEAASLGASASASASAAAAAAVAASTSTSASFPAAAAAAASSVFGSGVAGGWLFSESVPNGSDDNSAVVVQFQVGPNAVCLRRNALRSLLVHMAKRDVFAELRTRQQLGYIVSLHGGTEHGVGYVELVVQSNAHSAADVCDRIDQFLARFLAEDLPAKCGLPPPPPPPPPPAAAEAAAEAAGAAAAASAGTAADQDSSVATATAAAAAEGPAATAAAATATAGEPTEFEVAVEELAKSKLEKPKKLGDLASRWWSEIHHGSYCFDRREAEVAELRRITPGQMMAFAWEVLAGAGAEVGAGAPSSRRKLTIQVLGKAEGTRSEAPPAASTAAFATTAASPAIEDTDNTDSNDNDEAARQSVQPPTAAPEADIPATTAGAPFLRPPSSPYAVIPTADPFTWKRGCEAWPGTRAMWAARRAAAGEPPLPYSVAEEEVEELVRQLRREEEEAAAAAVSAKEA